MTYLDEIDSFMSALLSGGYLLSYLDYCNALHGVQIQLRILHNYVHRNLIGWCVSRDRLHADQIQNSTRRSAPHVNAWE